MDRETIRVGIDLGTTNTLACYLNKKGKLDLIKFPGTGKLIPSVIYVDEDDSKNIIVGSKARKMGILDPINEIRSAKTYMGDDKKTWTCNGLTFTPTDVAALVLQEVKKGILKKMKSSEDTEIEAIITVPAYFNSKQKEETKKAGERAGFFVKRIITEPMAAAVAAVKELNLNEKVFIVDLGGGTFDLSVLEAVPEKHIYKALDIDGDKKLGGDDFDRKVYEYFISIIEDDLGIDLSNQKNSGLDYKAYYAMVGQVREAAEIAKIELSDTEETIVNIPNLFKYNGKFYNFDITFTRNEFNGLCRELYDKIIGRIENFIASSKKFALEDIGEVILVGGSCYIPYIQNAVENIFHILASMELERDTLVAVGAGFIANFDNGGEDDPFKDILSHSLGIEVTDPQTHKSTLSKLLKKGETYPCQKSGIYTTISDNQTAIDINIYEAGSDCEDIADIARHDFLGSFRLDGIKKAPVGKPQIEVTFSFDNSQILTVQAKDLDSGFEKEIEVKKGERAEKIKRQSPVDFMLLIDTSGSMYGTPLAEAKEACYALLEEMIDFTVYRVGLVTFSSNAEMVSGLSANSNLLVKYVQNMKAWGSTNMTAALRLAYGELSKSTNEKVIIIVTDGAPDNSQSTLDYVGNLKGAHMRVISIGVGRGVNFDFLNRMSAEKDVYKLDNMSKLKDTFKKVVLSVTEK